MKKRLGIIAGILGIVLAVIGIVLKQKENTAVSVIGGADGPTSIFIAGKLNGDNFIFMIVVGIIILIYPVVDFLFNEKYQSVATYASFLAFASTAHGLGDVFNRFVGAHGFGKYLRNGAFISGGVAFIGYTLGVNGLDIVSAFSGSFGVIPFFIVFNSPTVSLNLPL